MIAKIEHSQTVRPFVRVSFVDGTAVDVRQCWPAFAGVDEIEKEARMVAFQSRAANSAEAKLVFAVQAQLVDLARVAKSLCEKFRSGATAVNDYWRALTLEPPPRFEGEAKRFKWGAVEKQVLGYQRDLLRLYRRLAGDECDKLYAHVMVNLGPNAFSEYTTNYQFPESEKRLARVATFYPRNAKRPPLDPPTEVVGQQPSGRASKELAPKPAAVKLPKHSRKATKPRLRIALGTKPAGGKKR